MSVINAVPLLAAAGGDYTISRSVRLRSSASAYFSRTPASAGNRKTWTWSGWVKRGALANGTLFDGGSTGPLCSFQFSSDQLRLYVTNTGITTSEIPITTAVFRDPSAWYHVVLALDTTQATATNRVKIYVNGVQQTITGLTGTVIGLNGDLGINRAVATNIGYYSYGSSTYFDGYLTEINFIDGQALTPSSFGETDTLTGVWKPKKYAGTYGTNGFYLNFSDNSNNTATTIGKDYSGNGNNWTPNNISLTAGTTYDSMIDSPTVSASSSNYAVLNPLIGPSTSTLTNGNLTFATDTSTAGAVVGTFELPSTGKYYWEVSPTTNGTECYIGIGKNGQTLKYVYRSNGNKYDGTTQTAYGASYTNNDVIGVAVDCSAQTITFYKNNVSQGTAFSSITLSSMFPYMEDTSGALSVTGWFNFGQQPFAYTPPSGFVALNTQNLPAPTISNGALYMAATTYTGNGGTQSITNTVNGVSFKPDLVWIKTRSATSYHQLIDSVRGVSTVLNSNYTGAESSYPGYSVTAFNSNGFTVVDDAAASYGVNGSTGSPTYVGWQWRAGQGTTSSNTSGSITSTVSVNATAGFSVLTATTPASYTNYTVGHGLGVTPSMIIYKERSGTANWWVWHTSFSTASNALQLNTTNAIQVGSYFGTQTSTVAAFQSGMQTGLSVGFVAYCWAAVPGYSAFGSYTGNGSTDGPFVFCGFRPRYVMIKRIDAAGFSWTIEDSSRSPYNASDKILYANLSDAENTGTARNDFLSNGFKARDSGNNNVSGGTYIYAAFSEVAFKFSLGR